MADLSAHAVTQAEIDQFHWFHSIDFGNGLASRGAKTLAYVAAEREAILGPIDLRGATVHDVGTFNGYYAFEAKRAGAERVVASDSWAWTSEYFRAAETFDLARSLLNLDVEAQEIDATEITVGTIGTFDVVLYLGVFYHLIEPVFCTRRIAKCATRLMIIETHIDGLDIAKPAMIFYPGSELNNDPSNWWGPNPQLIFHLMTICGFSRIYFREHSIHGRRGLFYCFRSQADADALLAQAPLPALWFDLSDAGQRKRVFAAEKAP